MKSNAQLLADMYAEQGGREQPLVAVYDDEAVLYANVTRETALRIAGRLSSLRSLVVVDTACSADGMTHCWPLRRSREHPGGGDWRDLVMVLVSGALRTIVPQLLPADGTVMYVDNRQLDANTLDAFCSYLRSQPAA